jgi:membrane protein DedA with SNARE-associated domain
VREPGDSRRGDPRSRCVESGALSHLFILVASSTNAHLTPHLHAARHHLPEHPAPHAVPRTRKARRAARIHLPILSHIRVHGPAIDYVGVFLLAILSGVGINGFGEAALIAAGVYVANHHIPVWPVILIAAAGGSVGGVAGFIIGKVGGRSIFTAPGPAARLRRRMLQHSEDVYLHYDVVAILVTPAWAAGIHGVRWPKFLWLNLLSALLWAGSLGLGAYYLGSRITTEFSKEIVWVVAGVAAVLVVYYFMRRMLRASRSSR